MDNQETTTTTTEEETTTTTTENEDTTTTTTEEVTTTTTVEHQGEQVIDKGARADIVGGNVDVAKSDAEVQDENIENAKQDALRNHAAEHADPAKDDGENPNQ